MDRAYAIFNVKSIDAEKRIITGLATSPEPDRVGDIIEPLGVTFKNPLPLLLFHDTKKPVGTTRFKKPTKSGIEFEATIAIINEPGTLKERVDEAWQSIKAGLVSGVSIGFRAIEHAFMQDTGGIRFLKTEVVELSLVTVPANSQATIQSIKSLDAPSRVAVHQPAAVGRSLKATTMPPIAEQIESTTATLRTKSSRLEELALRDGTDGGLEPDELTERDTLTGEVDTLSTRLKSFRAIESAQASIARPVLAAPPQVNTKAAQPTHVEVKSNLEPGIEFARYMICRMAAVKAAANGNFVSPMELAKAHYPDNPRIQWLLKDNVPAGTTTDATFAGPLVQAQTLVNEFVEYLRPQTVLGKISGLTRVPFNVRITGQTSGATGYWVGQGQSKPLTRFNLNAQSLGWAKVAAIIAITDELARFSSPSAETLVRNELVNALRERIDLDFLDPAKAAVAGVSPASITNGVTPLADTGATLANTTTDIQQFFNAMIGNNLDLAQSVWIMPTSVALQLSLMRDSFGALAFPTISINGGTWQGLPVIVSQYLVFGHTPANNKVLLVHAPSIALADDGGFTVDMSREASLEMDDQPVMASSSTAGSPSGPTGSALVSMFQTNSIAIRAERYINWAKLRSTAVVWMDDVRWAA